MERGAPFFPLDSTWRASFVKTRIVSAGTHTHECQALQERKKDFFTSKFLKYSAFRAQFFNQGPCSSWKDKFEGISASSSRKRLRKCHSHLGSHIQRATAARRCSSGIATPLKMLPQGWQQQLPADHPVPSLDLPAREIHHDVVKGK